MRYILKRFALYFFAFVISLVLNFLLPRLMPGDPVGTMFARFRGRLSPEAMEALKQSLGFSGESLFDQFWAYLSALAHGDLGLSIAYFPSPVTEVISTGLWWTLWLAGLSVLISFVLGTGLGIYIAWRRGSWLDQTLPPLFAFFRGFSLLLARYVVAVGFRLSFRLVSITPCLR